MESKSLSEYLQLYYVLDQPFEVNFPAHFGLE